MKLVPAGLAIRQVFLKLFAKNVTFASRQPLEAGENAENGKKYGKCSAARCQHQPATLLFCGIASELWATHEAFIVAFGPTRFRL